MLTEQDSAYPNGSAAIAAALKQQKDLEDKKVAIRKARADAAIKMQQQELIDYSQSQVIDAANEQMARLGAAQELSGRLQDQAKAWSDSFNATWKGTLDNEAERLKLKKEAADQEREAEGLGGIEQGTQDPQSIVPNSRTRQARLGQMTRAQAPWRGNALPSWPQ